ncbi:hypothetical protein [Aeromonas jandaei]|uniref:hypothetical protein n=1 Tax=Aeromonas jandaei TaxID=650 RepID=UPI003EC6112A
MAVPNKPFWLSIANAEFNANRWASNILSQANLSLPRYVGELAGKSSSVVLDLTIGEFSPGYETQLGYQRGVMGSISIGQFEGKNIEHFMCYDDLPNTLYFSLEGSTAKPILVTVSGLGSALIEGGYGTFNSIYSYFSTRRGSVVQVTLATG